MLVVIGVGLILNTYLELAVYYLQVIVSHYGQTNEIEQEVFLRHKGSAEARLTRDQVHEQSRPWGLGDGGRDGMKILGQ